MTRREQYESYLRSCLANTMSGPCHKRSIKTDAEIIRWLQSLGPARSAWETGWLERLKAAQT